MAVAPAFQLVNVDEYNITDTDATVQQIAAADIATWFSVLIDNSDNSVTVYLKVLDAGSSPTIGTDEPDWVIAVPAGVKREFTPNGAYGLTIDNDLFFWCVTGAGVAGTASPASKVKVTLRAT